MINIFLYIFVFSLYVLTILKASSGVLMIIGATFVTPSWIGKIPYRSMT